MSTAFHVGSIPRCDSYYRGPKRVSRTGALVTSESGYGRFYELASRGQVYTAMVSSITTPGFTDTTPGLTSASSPGQQLGAAANPILAILNPVGSGVVFEILQGYLCFTSGVPGDNVTGAWSWCGAVVGRSVTAAESGATKAPMLVGQGVTRAKAWSLATLTGAPVQPVIRPFPAIVLIDPTTGVDSTNQGVNPVDNVDGAIVVPPGGLLTLAPPATGTSHVVGAGIMYAEVPLPS